MKALPTGWSYENINSLTSQDGVFVDGDWVESKDQDPNGEVRLIQLADIKEFKFLDKSDRYLTVEKSKRLRCTYLKKDDVLIARMPDPIGRACLFPFEEEDKYVTVVDVAIARTNPESVLPKWLMYFINAPQFRQQIIENASGSTRLRISRKNLGLLELPCPPLPEQQRIGAKLDTLFGHLDQLKGRLEKIPALLKQFRQAVLTQAFQGRLTEEWAKNNSYTPVRESLEVLPPLPKPSRYNSRTTSTIPGKFALSVGKPELEIPKRFEWVELVSVARLESGHTPSRKHSEYWKDGDVCWIGIKDASDNHSNTLLDTYQKTNALGLQNSAARLLPAGTVCLSRTASVGYVVKMGKPMATSQDFVNWVCSDAIDPDWLKWLLVAEEESIWNFGKGTTHKTVYFPEVISFHVALPPIEEQREIVRRIEALFVRMNEIDALSDMATARIERLPQTILSIIFRGGLQDGERVMAADGMVVTLVAE